MKRNHFLCNMIRKLIINPAATIKTSKRTKKIHSTHLITIENQDESGSSFRDEKRHEIQTGNFMYRHGVFNYEFGAKFPVENQQQ